MLYVKFDKLDFEMELLDIIRLFFCDTEIDILQDGAFVPGDGMLISGSLRDINGSSSYIMEFLHRESRLEEHVPVPDGIPGKTSIEARKAFKREIRRGLYMLLSRWTGIQLPWGMLTGIRPAKIVHEMMEKGHPENEITEHLKNYYRLSSTKAELLYKVAAVEKGLLDKSPPGSVSIYIGIPFCNSRCLYCSFTSYPILRYSGFVKGYFSALRHELASVNEMIKSRGQKLQSLYIGGGTPTSVAAADLKDLLGFIEANMDISALEEYTLEAGRPDSIDAEKLEAIKNSAVTRISINPQTMNDGTLKLIGRNHTGQELVDAYRLARKMGFDNINMDVIVGLPGENPGIFEDTLKQLQILDPESMTVHTMALKRASRLKTEGMDYSLVPQEQAEAMVGLAYEYTALMGMHPYYLYRQKNMLGNLENVGYCKPGFESIYNVQIMEEKQTIFAAGAGAVTKVVYPGEDRIERAFNVKNVEEYILRINEMIGRKKALL